MHDLNGERAKFMGGATVVIAVRLVLAILQTVEVVREPEDNAHLVISAVAWLVTGYVVLGGVVLYALAYVWALGPFVDFLHTFVDTSGRFVSMEVVVAVTWLRTQLRYFVFLQIAQAVVLGVAFATMAFADDVDLWMVLAGDLAFTITVGLGMYIVMVITYYETDYEPRQTGKDA